MTLEETIKRYEEKAEIYKNTSKSKEYFNLSASREDREVAEEYFRLVDWLRLLKEILDCGDCNDCGNRECLYRPKPGQMVRYRCPFYQKKENKNGN